MQDEMSASAFSLHLSCITPSTFSEVLFNVIIILQFGSLQKAWMVSLAVKGLVPPPEDSSVPGSKWWSQESVCLYSGDTALRSIWTLRREGGTMLGVFIITASWTWRRANEIKIEFLDWRCRWGFFCKKSRSVSVDTSIYMWGVKIGHCLLLNKTPLKPCARKLSWTPLFLTNWRRKSWWKQKGCPTLS